MNVAWTPLRSFQSASQAEAWNGLLGFLGQRLPLARPSASVSFEVAEFPPSGALALSVRPEAGPGFVASFRKFPFDALFGAKLNVDDLPSLPSALRDAILHGMIAFVWDAIPDNRMGAFAVERMGVAMDLAGENRVEWFVARIEGLAPEPIELAIGCSIAALQEFLLGGRSAPPQIDRAVRGRVCLDAFVSIGRLALPLMELRKLAIGDVVMMAERDGRMIVRVDRATFEVAPQEAGWLVLSSRWEAPEPVKVREGNEMSSEDAGETLDVSKLMINVDFDIGRVSKPLAEIETWRPGSVIVIDAPQLAEGVEVTLRVNGAAVGVGDLIKVDERLAVRVCRWTR